MQVASGDHDRKGKGRPTPSLRAFWDYWGSDMGESSARVGRLDGVQLLERVLRDLEQENLVAPMTKAAGARAGATRVTQLKRALEAGAARGDHE